MTAERCDTRWWLLPVGALALGLLLTIPFWTSDLDLRVAAWVQAWNGSRGGDEQENRWWWVMAYYVPATLIGLLVLGSLVALVRGHRREAIYVLLVLALGSGVIVNMTLKDNWGRPRPRETVQFGGSREYLPPWQIGTPGKGKSFPSGHVAVPPLGIALWLLWRRRRPALARWALGGGLVLTAWVGGQRMLANGHWLSDVLWSLVLMTVIAAVLHRLVVREADAGRAP